ncbi:hypothetical protein EJ06DRAFT_567434 [Trichodelitschia bisporula]|uniref:Uncharacterized protein n=1 Tax=Trichodelitschia bisporula TaxID=703511 RepID=A0A6G1HM49_9PEZI|nr:hypothetical protein EJ06DRAFT_567434 [Trichodelitschia bisporula]
MLHHLTSIDHLAHPSAGSHPRFPIPVLIYDNMEGTSDDERKAIRKTCVMKLEIATGRRIARLSKPISATSSQVPTPESSRVPSREPSQHPSPVPTPAAELEHGQGSAQDIQAQILQQSAFAPVQVDEGRGGYYFRGCWYPALEHGPRYYINRMSAGAGGGSGFGPFPGMEEPSAPCAACEASTEEEDAYHPPVLRGTIAGKPITLDDWEDVLEMSSSKVDEDKLRRLRAWRNPIPKITITRTEDSQDR